MAFWAYKDSSECLIGIYCYINLLSVAEKAENCRKGPDKARFKPSKRYATSVWESHQNILDKVFCHILPDFVKQTANPAPQKCDTRKISFHADFIREACDSQGHGWLVSEGRGENLAPRGWSFWFSRF